MVQDASGKEVVEDALPPAEEENLLGGAKADETPDPDQESKDAEAKATAEAAKVKEQEAQAAIETENKRILETEDAQLTAEELAKKPALVKAAEEKRLLETPDDKLTAEEKTLKAALVKAKEDATKDKEGKAPEKYEDFKLPEGVQIFDAPLLEEAKVAFKELNLSQSKAQRLIDLQVKAAESLNKMNVEGFIKVKNEWKAETQKLLGASWKADRVTAGKAIEILGTPELRKMLIDTGVGNHPELVKFFIEAGKLVSEDTLVNGKRKTLPKSDGELFYGNTMDEKK